MLTRSELIDELSGVEDPAELEQMTKAELLMLYNEYLGRSGMFPNDDAYDGSYNYD